MSEQPANLITLDVVSDVVCPWCIIGLKRLGIAMAEYGEDVQFTLQWHPFELNPQMPPEGENLQEHIMAKYGMSREKSNQGRANLTALGKDLGFEFNYRAESRMVNTFKAHQLLHWAAEQGKQTPLKLALFKAYFTDQLDVSQEDVLTEVATSVGLPGDEVAPLLEEQTYAQTVREQQDHWRQMGIQGVPAYIVNRQYLISGAQEPGAFRQLFDQILDGEAAS